MPHVPLNDEPDCEMSSVMAHTLGRFGAHVVPFHFPATFTVDGAVGVELQLVPSMTVRTAAARLRRCMLVFPANS